MGIKTRQLATEQGEENKFNVSLLGFKMAVNEGLTVFNLVDGVVDEFHDESGTDEGEGSNDRYVAASDYYINSSQDSGTPGTTPFSAGFSMTAVTEPDTSTAGNNPTHGTAALGTFTVPAGTTSLAALVWGAGGGGGGIEACASYIPRGGGSGGFASGTLAVTAGQVLRVAAGEGGRTQSTETFVGGAAFGGGILDGESPEEAAKPGQASGGGGGLAGLVTENETTPTGHAAPEIYIVAGAGGGGSNDSGGGSGGGLTGDAGPGAAPGGEQVNGNTQSGGGGDQEQGGQGLAGADSYPIGNGAFLKGGNGQEGPNGANAMGSFASGGAGYYGGGGGARNNPQGPNGDHVGGGGSSYYGHPQITSGATEEGNMGGTENDSGGAPNPNYPVTSEAGETTGFTSGNDGYVLLTGTRALTATTTATTIVSGTFAATDPVTTGRIVVFEENVDTPTLNTDVIASISRDGGSNFTTATLTDSGYVTGSSGQRILTGQANVSGQPAGQSMRWKLALANNTVKIHGVSLQWS